MLQNPKLLYLQYAVACWKHRHYVIVKTQAHWSSEVRLPSYNVHKQMCLFKVWVLTWKWGGHMCDKELEKKGWEEEEILKERRGKGEEWYVTWKQKVELVQDLEPVSGSRRHHGRARREDEVTQSIMTQVHKTPLIYILTLKINKRSKMNELKEN